MLINNEMGNLTASRSLTLWNGTIYCITDIYCAVYIANNRVCLIPTPAHAWSLHMQTHVLHWVACALVLGWTPFIRCVPYHCHNAKDWQLVVMDASSSRSSICVPQEKQIALLHSVMTNKTINCNSTEVFTFPPFFRMVNYWCYGYTIFLFKSACYCAFHILRFLRLYITHLCGLSLSHDFSLFSVFISAQPFIWWLHVDV